MLYFTDINSNHLPPVSMKILALKNTLGSWSKYLSPFTEPRVSLPHPQQPAAGHPIT